MKRTVMLAGMLAGALAGSAAGLELVPAPEPQMVFAGGNREIKVIWHNPASRLVDVPVWTRLLQASSETVMPVAATPWKRLRALPGQTIMESARFDFPMVKAETKFLVQWAENSNQIAGLTEVLVYPTNQLSELKRLLSDSANELGVLDFTGGFKPVLTGQSIRYVDVSESNLDHFSGRLLIIGPGSEARPGENQLTERVRQLAERGVAVVWIRSLPITTDRPWPSFFLIPQTKSAVLVVQPDLLNAPLQNPAAQRNLVYFCKLALNPTPPSLPEVAIHP